MYEPLLAIDLCDRFNLLFVYQILTIYYHHHHYMFSHHICHSITIFFPFIVIVLVSCLCMFIDCEYDIRRYLYSHIDNDKKKNWCQIDQNHKKKLYNAGDAKKKYKHTFKPVEKTIEFKRTHKTSIFTWTCCCCCLVWNILLYSYSRYICVALVVIFVLWPDFIFRFLFSFSLSFFDSYHAYNMQNEIKQEYRQNLNVWILVKRFGPHSGNRIVSGIMKENNFKMSCLCHSMWEV